MRFACNYVVFGLLFIVPCAQCGSWSAWEPCSKSCSGGVQSRIRNCTISEKAADEFGNCTGNKITQTRNCRNRPCSDFAIKCFQCSGSDVFCHHSKLQRNHTQDACNKYHDRCITKLFELDVGVREIMRGCGNREECEVAKDKCKRKAYPYNNCRVTCCEQDYCNSSNRVSGRLYDVVFILCSIFLSLELFLNIG